MDQVTQIDQATLIAFIGCFQAVLICGFGAYVSIKTLKMQLDAATLKKTLHKVHILVNSNYGVALKAVAVLSRGKSDKSGKPEDIKAAEDAELKLAEHEEAQARVDAIPEKEYV